MDAQEEALIREGAIRPDARHESERLRAVATRNLIECCDECRALLREQLEREERRAVQ